MCSSTDNTVSRAREDTHIESREYEDNPNETNQHNNTESRNKLYTAYNIIIIIIIFIYWNLIYIEYNTNSGYKWTPQEVIDLYML